MANLMLFGGTETMPAESPMMIQNQGSASNRMVDKIHTGTTVMCPYTMESRLTGFAKHLCTQCDRRVPHGPWDSVAKDLCRLRSYSVIAIVPAPIIAASLRPAYPKLHYRILSGCRSARIAMTQVDADVAIRHWTP